MRGEATGAVRPFLDRPVRRSDIRVDERVMTHGASGLIARVDGGARKTMRRARNEEGENERANSGDRADRAHFSALSPRV